MIYIFQWISQFNYRRIEYYPGKPGRLDNYEIVGA